MTRSLKRRMIGLFSILAGLGVGGCSYTATAMYGVAMYGPAPAYGVQIVAHVHGTIADKAGAPLAGILVVVKDAETYKEAVTGADGTYAVTVDQLTDKETAYITAVDIDGPANGAQATGNATVAFDLTKTQDYPVNFTLDNKGTP